MSGNVVVADRVNNRIMVFDQLGGFVRKWGGPGAGDLQFNDPYGVAVDLSVVAKLPRRRSFRPRARRPQDGSR